MDRLILKVIWKFKQPRRVKIILKKKRKLDDLCQQDQDVVIL